MAITREHLEMAALAAGLRHVNYDGLDYDGRGGLVLVDGIGRHLEDWRPHLDDGDAAPPAARLNMEINMDHGQVAATVKCAAAVGAWRRREARDGCA